MKAAVLHEFKQPLVFKEVPPPQLQPSDILIKVEACGVCHSDLHLADGDWSQLAAIVKRPLIEAAPLFCAGVTVFRALKQARVSPGQRLAVLGVGGLGHLAVQIGRVLGADVTAIDISDEKLALAKSLGASTMLNAATANVTRELRGKGGVHVALVASAARAAYDMAFSCVRPTGTLLVVGLPAENICFPPILMAAGEVRIQATAVGTRQDLRDVLALAGAGKIRCRVGTRPLSDANQALDLLRSGQVSGRIVLAIP